ncbi:MAG: preprotein translocase subunit YajC [Clostridia bacterium]|nr:preprotein translocase subunit YajC [Clostridia bacterium]
MNFINVLAFGVESVLMLAILVFLVVLMVLGYMKRRKFNTQLQDLRNNIKVGDKVMTDTGVVGEIVDISTEGEHKYFVIKSGTETNFGFVKVHANAVYYVFDNNTPKYATTEKVEDDDLDITDEDVDNE